MGTEKKAAVARKRGEASTSNNKPSPKKRKRPTPTDKRQTTAATAVAAPTLHSCTSTTKNSLAEAPTHTLILDNGGDTIKYGWCKQHTGSHVDDDETLPQPPAHLPNVTARLQQQWTVLVGDELAQIQNPNQLVHVTRSTERGIICNLGNQVQVWKRLLDLVNVSITMSSSDTAQAFGWTAAANKKKKGSAVAAEQDKIPARQCAVLILLPPFTLRVLLDQILAVWMDDFGFGHVGFAVSPVCAAERGVRGNEYRTTCLVDVGWSATHVVPVYQHAVVPPATNTSVGSSSRESTASTTSTTIRRLPVGGRHLINMLKYYSSYRQWNLMDQEWIFRHVLHQTAYVSMQFNQDMRVAQTIVAGRRPFDREFVLPDAQNNFQGKVQLPPALQREMQTSDEQRKQQEQDEESEDESVKEEDMLAAEDDNDDDDGGGAGEDASDDDEDDEEETVEQAKQRLIKQRQQEERLRRDLEAEQQVLNISVERFAVPEVLFRPGDAGLPLEWASLPVAIVQSIQSCPKEFHPALYRSIKLVGGLSRLENLSIRLEQELRSLVPCAYDIKLEVSESPLNEAWFGACRLVARYPYTKWSISREEWDASSKTSVWKRLLASNGGEVV